ncbi:MAG: multiheme c-type cytochrome [Polyangiales bacterium]
MDAGGAYVLNDGRQGQGVLVVDLFLDGPRPFLDWSDWSMDTKRENVDARIHELEARIAAWKRDPKIAKADIAAQQTRLGELQRERAALRLPATVSQRAFNARWIRLDRTAAQDAAVTAQMKAYDHRVNEHNRVAYASRVPRPAPPGMPHFVGSKACATCHKAAFDWWRETKHGHAYKTLVDVEKQYNLSCVGCHVTGYELPGGSTVTHNLDGALVDVGCENCHGAGSAHIAEPSAADKVLRDTPEATCRSCHNSEHSDLFAFTAYRAMLMAPGHGMPLEAPSKPAKP